MRAGFLTHLVRNRRKLWLLLALVFGITAGAGFLVGQSLERMWEPPAYSDADGVAGRSSSGYPRQCAAALLALAATCYLRIRRHEARRTLSLLGVTHPRDTKLQNIAAELALAAGMKPPEMFVIEDASRNAFACGARGLRAIVVTRGLLDGLDRDELQGVIAHEFTHIRHGDTELTTIVNGMARVCAMTAALALGPLASIRSLSAGLTARRRRVRTLVGTSAVILAVILIFPRVFQLLPLLVLVLALRELWRLNNVPRATAPNPKPTMFMVPVGVVLGPAILILGVLYPCLLLMMRLSISRHQEFAADAGAVELTRQPDALANALRKLQDGPHTPSLSDIPAMTTAPAGNRFFATLPTLDERIDRLVDMGARPIDPAARERATVPAS